MAMVNVRVKSRISNQESSVDEDEMRFERRDTMDARDPAGAPKIPFSGFVWFRILSAHIPLIFRSDKETSESGG